MYPSRVPRGGRNHGQRRRRNGFLLQGERGREYWERMSIPNRVILLAEILAETVEENYYETHFRSITELTHRWRSLRVAIQMWVKSKAYPMAVNDMPKYALIDSCIMATEAVTRKLWSQSQKIAFAHTVVTFTQLEL